MFACEPESNTALNSSYMPFDNVMMTFAVANKTQSRCPTPTLFVADVTATTFEIDVSPLDVLWRPAATLEDDVVSEVT